MNNLKGEALTKNSESYKLPIVIDENFSRYLQKFMHSYRNIEHPTININNLLFLSGPQKSGKSWFLRHNLKKFAQADSEIKTLVVHYDINDIPKQNFNSFLFNFEKEIIKSIVERNQYEKNNFQKSLIDFEELKDLLFYRWEKGWLDINLSKSLRRSINENESPYTFYVDESKYRDEVLALLEKYERKAFKEYPLVEELNKINEIIADSMGIDNLESGLLLFQDLLIQREDYTKNQIIFQHELYRNGLEVMEFFFDVLNYIAGYHETQLKKEEFQEKDSEKTIYPHVVVALECMGNIFEIKDSENRPLNYLHRIMLRLFNNSGYRNHFPIVMETDRNYYFDKTIYQELWEMKYTLPSLVYLPTQFWNTLEKSLDGIFNNYQKIYTLDLLGDSSIYYYDAYIEAIKAHDQKEKFPNCGQFFKYEYNKFLHKLNRVYVNPNMALSLDKGTIDYEIVDTLLQWKKITKENQDPYITLRREIYDNEFLSLRTTIALFEENLTFFNKYFKRVNFEQHIYSRFNLTASDEMYKNKINTLWKKMYFNFYYYHFKAFKFSINYWAMGNKRYMFSMLRYGWEFSSKQWVWGTNLKWDVPDELYKGVNQRYFYFRNYEKTTNMY